MATYPINIPPLPPLISGVPDNPANGISIGDQIRDEDVIAATLQHKTRERLSEVNYATVVEVNDAKKRKNEVEGHNFAGPIHLGQRNCSNRSLESSNCSIGR